MIFSLYETEDSANTINKVLTNKQSFDIALKKDTSVSDPSIKILSDQDLTHYNYAEIEHFNRFYFITSVELIGNNLYRFNLSCDLIESFKEDIFKSKQLNYNQSVQVVIDIVEADVDPKLLFERMSEVSYVMSTLGVDKNDVSS